MVSSTVFNADERNTAPSESIGTASLFVLSAIHRRRSGLAIQHAALCLTFFYSRERSKMSGHVTDVAQVRAVKNDCLKELTALTLGSGDES